MKKSLFSAAAIFFAGIFLAGTGMAQSTATGKEDQSGQSVQEQVKEFQKETGTTGQFDQMTEPEGKAGQEQQLGQQQPEKQPAQLQQSGQQQPGLAQQGKAGGQQQSADQVRQVQQQLQAQGIDPGPIDGIMGPKTSSALERFQQQQGLAATGKIDQQTIQSLGIEPEGQQEFMGVSPSFEGGQQQQQQRSGEGQQRLDQQGGSEREQMQKQQGQQPGSSSQPESGGMGQGR